MDVCTRVVRTLGENSNGVTVITERGNTGVKTVIHSMSSYNLTQAYWSLHSKHANPILDIWSSP